MESPSDWTVCQTICAEIDSCLYLSSLLHPHMPNNITVVLTYCLICVEDPY